MRIAFLADPDSVNGWYRAYGPMSMLAARGHVVVPLSVDRKKPPVGAIRGVDVLHIHRYADERAERLVREARARGVAVVWDDDDNGGALPKGSTAYRRYGGHGWERRLASMRRVFRSVDLVTTPSDVLAGALERYGAPRTLVIENYVPKLFLEHRRPESRQEITVGWLAAMEHQVDVERIPIMAALQRLLDTRSDVRVRTIGLRLGLTGAGYEHIRHVDHLETVEVSAPDAALAAPKGMRQANRGRADVTVEKIVPGGLANHTAAFDVGIAPVADIDFNRSRSNIKLKEYAAGGTPWLASPVGPYRGMGERQGGRLVADDRWYEELCALIDKPRALRKLAKRATQWVESETIEQNVHRWEAALEQALSARQARGAEAPDARGAHQEPPLMSRR
jgi:glycosyltransferase involved in cell wall biosynthesis